jgi:hypothetical protein
MKSHLFETIAGLTLIALSLVATFASGQTVISNEALVTTTFVVNKTAATARCGRAGCRAKTQVFAPIPVTCPAAMGQTCTFHISLDAKTSVVIPPSCNCFGGGPTGFYEFLIDGVAPTIGPTDENGDYIFVKNGFTSSLNLSSARQSHPASVLTTVTNSNSNNHTVVVNVGCSDININGAYAGWSDCSLEHDESGRVRALKKERFSHGVGILRWKSPTLPGTSLPQDDSGVLREDGVKFLRC